LFTIEVKRLFLFVIFSFSFYLKADYLRNLFEYYFIGTIILLDPCTSPTSGLNILMIFLTGL